MPEFLPLIARLGGWMKQGAKAVATGSSTGKLGLQSPELSTAMVRIGRFLYVTTLGWIGISYYTGYVNERTKEGEMKFLLPAGNLPVISPPDRKDKTLPGLKAGNGPLSELLGTPGGVVEKLAAPGIPFGIAYQSPATGGRTLVALSPAQLGTPGTAMAGYLWSAPSGQKQTPPYSAARYRALLNVAMRIANNYGLKISSGYRPQSNGSLHSFGLAFDMVGSVSSMKRAASWAAQSPGVFQEIFIHNEGSGLHLHLGLYPDAASVLNAASNRYRSAANGQSPAPAVSRAILT